MIRALQSSTKTSLRIDNGGLLCLQLLMSSPGPKGANSEAFTQFSVSSALSPIIFDPEYFYSVCPLTRSKFDVVQVRKRHDVSPGVSHSSDTCTTGSMYKTPLLVEPHSKPSK